MPQSAAKNWDSMKDIIHDLFIVHNMPLGVHADSPGQHVIGEMIKKHSFRASKSEYESQFRKWGFRKRAKRAAPEEWQIASYKLARATEAAGPGKKPRLYHHRDPVTSKKLRASGYITELRRLELEHKTSPIITPPFFTICMSESPQLEASPEKVWLPSQSPVNPSYPFMEINFSSIIEGLSAARPDLITAGLGRLIGVPSKSSLGFEAEFTTLLPRFLSRIHLPESPSDLRSTVGRFGTHDFLRLALYLVSNNLELPNDHDNRKMYSWLKSIGLCPILTSMADSQVTSEHAFVDTLFPMVIMRDDADVVDYLLDRRPAFFRKYINSRCCDLGKGYLPKLTPLEFACISGSLTLGRTLIRHGATIQESRDGPLRSTLVLAIFGLFLTAFTPVLVESQSEAHELSPWWLSHNRPSVWEVEETTRDAELVTFIDCLVSIGASTELLPYLPRLGSDYYKMTPITAEDLGGLTPLTAAAWFNSGGLVNYLLDSHGNKMATSRKEHYMMALRLWLNHRGGIECLGRSSFTQVCERLLSAVVDPRTGLPASPDLLSEAINAWSLFRCMEFTDLFSKYCAPTNLAVRRSVEKRSLKLFRKLRTAGGECGEHLEEVMELIMGRFHEGEELWLTCLLDTCGLCNESPLDLLYAATKASRTLGAWVQRLSTFYLKPLSSYSPAELAPFLGELCAKADSNLVLHLASGINIAEALKVLEEPIVCQSIQSGNLDMADFLVGAGLAVNCPTREWLIPIRRGWGGAVDLVPGDEFSTALTAGVKAGDMPLVVRLRAAGAEISVTGSLCPYSNKPRTANALVTAAEVGNLPMVEYLIREGADINSSGKIRCENSQSFDGGLGVPMCKQPRDEMTYHSGVVCSCGTPLAAAILGRRKALIPYLLGKQASVDNCVGCGISPLAAAIMTENQAIFNHLISHGADPLDLSAILAAQYATRWQSNLRWAGFIWLLTAFSPERTQHLRSGENANKLLELLFRRLADDSLNVLWCSYEELHGLAATVVKSRIVPVMGHVDKSMKDGYLPYSAIPLFKMGNAGITEAFLKPFLSEVRNPNHMIVDEEGYSVSVLRLAVLWSNAHVVRFLLQSGVRDTDAGSAFELKAHMKMDADLIEYGSMQLAAKLNCFGILRVLLDHGLDPDLTAQGQERSCLLESAIIGNDTDQQRESLNSEGIEDCEDSDSIESCKDCGWIMSPDDSRGETPLQIALRNGLPCAEAALLLIYCGANVNAPPSPHRGATPLQYAAMHGLMGLSELLIERGADVNAPPAIYDGRTALEAAAETGRIDIIQLLINKGVRPIGPAFERALERATKNGRFAVMGLLGKLQSEWM